VTDLPTARTFLSTTSAASRPSPAQKSCLFQLCPTPTARTFGNAATTRATSATVSGADMRKSEPHACLPWKLDRSWPATPSSPNAGRGDEHASSEKSVRRRKPPPDFRAGLEVSLLRESAP
jgi:hypothetical protein